MRQVAVIGLGKLGTAVVGELIVQGAEVIAIDRRKEAVEGLRDTATYAATLNATDENALRGVGVQNVDVAVVCIGDDVEANLLATLLLKRLGVRSVWSRAISPLQQEILRRLDVDSIINLEEDMGRTVARSLVSTSVAKHIPLGEGYVIAELPAPATFLGKTLRSLAVRETFGVNIVAIKKPIPQITDTGERTFGEAIENVPGPDVHLEEGDILIVVGRDEDIAGIAKV